MSLSDGSWYVKLQNKTPIKINVHQFSHKHPNRALSSMFYVQQLGSLDEKMVCVQRNLPGGIFNYRKSRKCRL